MRDPENGDDESCTETKWYSDGPGIMFWVVVLILTILFAGEPDIAAAIIFNMTNGGVVPKAMQ